MQLIGCWLLAVGDPLLNWLVLQQCSWLLQLLCLNPDSLNTSPRSYLTLPPGSCKHPPPTPTSFPLPDSARVEHEVLLYWQGHVVGQAHFTPVVLTAWAGRLVGWVGG